MSDSVGGSIVANLIFSSSNSGDYFATNPAYSAYQVGEFAFYSGEVPDSIAGSKVNCTIAAGLYPLASTGTFAFAAPASGNNFVVTGDKVNTTSARGTYSYSKLNSTTGMVQFTEKAGSSITYFSFSAPASTFPSSLMGAFAAVSLSLGGYQIGTFSIPQSAPFASAKGSYNGLFAPTNGAAEANVGMLKGLTVSQKGTFSGALVWNGKSHAFTGSFDSNGEASIPVAGLELQMTLNPTNVPAPNVTGTVAGAGWTANLKAVRGTNTSSSAAYTRYVSPT